MGAPVIFWFRQDLRLTDQPALRAASAVGPVIPVFVLDDATPRDWRWGSASRWWLNKSLAALSAHVPLVLKRGRADEILQQLITESGAQGIYFTRDYAPWSPALEDRLKKQCDARGVACHRHGGFLLHEPESIRNGSGQPFKVYTPFSRACFARGAPRASWPLAQVTWAKHALKSEVLENWELHPKKPDWSGGLASSWTPGEAGARKALQHFLEHGLAGYADGRDLPAAANTSRLSPHLHWGEISPLQVWHAVQHRVTDAGGALDRDGEKFLKELLWREFSHHLLHMFPDLPNSPFRAEFENFPWRTDAQGLQAWQRGETGYPIVDAGLRELWATGIMHNRVRMIAASFLIKHLLIPWQQGERWFWDTLVDADLGNNAAGWQWVAGCGADAAPYFRIFNPVLQGEKFDRDGAYVKRWLPELRDVPAALVHRPWEMDNPPRDYPPPAVDHAMARVRALAAFQSLPKET